jgi:hypothetical protein
MNEQPSLWIFPILIHDLHRVFANVPGRTVERVDLRFRENTGTSRGVKPGPPQNLICHLVPDARKTVSQVLPNQKIVVPREDALTPWA